MDELENGDVDWSEEDIPHKFREDFIEPGEKKKRCPTCQNEIPEEAIRCHFCGRHVPVQSGFLARLNSSSVRLIAGLVALLGFLSVMAWLF